MRSFHCFFQMVRIQHILMGTLTTWIVVALSEGSTSAKVLAPLVIALQIAGASLFYFAVANQMYGRKHSGYLLANWPIIIMGVLGLLAMVSGTIISAQLSYSCLAVAIFNPVVIVLYKDYISKWWLSKNLLMAAVCITPVLLGWWAGSGSTHPAVPGGAVAVFFTYLAREIIKDIQDMEVDRHRRRTLPLERGVGVARVLAGTSMLGSLFFLSRIMTDIVSVHEYLLALVLTIVFFLGRVTICLLFAKTIDAKALSKQILLGIACLILVFGLLIV